MHYLENGVVLLSRSPVYSPNHPTHNSQLSILVCAGEPPLLSCNHFSEWLRDYFFWNLVNSKRPALQPWPSPLPFPQALKGLLREVPVLEQEPTDPGDLRGRTLWKYFHEDKLWWKGLVLSHNSETYQVGA